MQTGRQSGLTWCRVTCSPPDAVTSSERHMASGLIRPTEGNDPTEISQPKRRRPAAGVSASKNAISRPGSHRDGPRCDNGAPWPAAVRLRGLIPCSCRNGPCKNKKKTPRWAQMGGRGSRCSHHHRGTWFRVLSSCTAVLSRCPVSAPAHSSRPSPHRSSHSRTGGEKEEPSTRPTQLRTLGKGRAS